MDEVYLLLVCFDVRGKFLTGTHTAFVSTTKKNTGLLLTVYSMEGVGVFFVGGLWSADDLQHGALRLRGL